MDNARIHLQLQHFRHCWEMASRLEIRSNERYECPDYVLLQSHLLSDSLLNRLQCGAILAFR